MIRSILSWRRPLAAALFACLIASCGGEGGTAPIAVATLGLSGVPAAPLLVGSTVQLTGLPRDASGNILADRAVTFTSSDTLVARVAASGLVSGVGAGVASITATSEHATTVATLEFRVGGALGTDGGTISVMGGLVTVSLPVGALAQSSIVTVSMVPMGADPRLADGRAYEIGPPALTLARAGSLTLRYDRSRLGGTNEASLMLGTFQNGAWSLVQGSSVSPANGTVTGSITRGGTYAVLIAPIDHIVISGAPASGQLFVGQSAQLSATSLDSAGNQLGGRVITWTSSDPSILSVSTAGRLTAMQPGTAVVSAAAEGKSTTATVRVALVPVANVAVTPNGPALYAGATLQLAAVARDSAGTVITGRKITWRSADAAVATVDSTGLVTGVGAGSAIISATADAQTGNSTVSVLPAVVADWSGATEWGTFQGTATHTGYVPVVADPAKFRTAWTATPYPGVALNPVTAGDGNLAVSTNAYFGRQSLSVLDESTGTVKWSYEFGSIHSVDPPAYAGGAVYVQTGGQTSDSYLWSFEGGTGVVRSRSAYGNQWSRYYAPTVVDQSVYVAGGTYGGMYSFGTNGARNWFLQLEQVDQFTPAVRDGVVYAYVGVNAAKLSAVNATTGVVQFEIPDPSYAFTLYSAMNALALGDANDALAIESNRLVSFDLVRHAIAWSVTGAFTGNVTVANGVLYVLNNGAVEARRESDGQFLWLWTPPEGRVAGTLVATGNLLFASTAAATYAIDLSAHKTVWSQPAGGLLALGASGRLFIAGADGKITAVALK